MERDRIGEIQDRLRRVETRLTKWMESCGFDTQVQKCELTSRGVDIPSMDVRLKDILGVGSVQIMEDGVTVFHKNQPVCEIYLLDK